MSGAEAEALVEAVVASSEWEAMVRQLLTELKRGGEVHAFEDDVHKALRESARDGKLAHTAAAVTEALVKKKTKDVRKEIEKRLGSHLDRKIQRLVESSYWKDKVDDVVHDAAKRLARGGASPGSSEDGERPEKRHRAADESRFGDSAAYGAPRENALELAAAAAAAFSSAADDATPWATSAPTPYEPATASTSTFGYEPSMGT